MNSIGHILAYSTLAIASIHIACGEATDDITLMENYAPILAPNGTGQELSAREHTLAQQARQQKRLWQEGIISRDQYFTTVGNWLMAKLALSRWKTPNQALSPVQRELAENIIDNFQTRIDTLARLASVGQAAETDPIKLKLNLLIFQRDLAIASGATYLDIIQKQKNIIDQTDAWLACVQQAIDHHLMGNPDLRNPQTIREREQNRLKLLENTLLFSSLEIEGQMQTEATQEQ